MTRRTLPLLGLAALCLAVPPASAQVQVGPRRRGVLHVRDTYGSVVLGGSHLREQQRGRGRQWDREELRLGQRLRLGVMGDIYHRRLARFNLVGDLNLDQELVSDQYRVFPGGEITLVFLEQHPYSLRLNAFSGFGRTQRSFARSYETVRLRLGALVRKRGPVPAELEYRHESLTRTAEGEGFESIDTVDTVEARATYKVGADTAGNLSYQFNDFDFQSTAQPRRSQQQHLFQASHATFLRKGRDRFDARLRVLEYEGDGAWRNIRGGARLQLVEGRGLWIQEEIQIQRTSQPGSDRFVNDVNEALTLRHQLFESLYSVGTASFRAQDASFGDSTETRGTLTEAYQKRLGDWGQLAVSLDVNGTLLTQSSRVDRGFEVDEALLLTGSDAVDLARLDVFEDSIVVTDPAGRAIYIPEIDYGVVTRGRVTSINRTPTGAIPDGERVLVDYEFGLAPPGKTLTDGLGIYTQLRVGRGLRAYGRATRTQSRPVGTQAGDPFERSQYLLGLAATGDFWVVVVEGDRSDTDGFKVWGLSEQLTLTLPGRDMLTGRLSGSHSTAWYDEESAVQTRWIATLSSLLAATSDLRFRLEGDYHRERWDGGLPDRDEDLDAVGVQVAADWRYRELYTTLGGRESWIEQKGQISTSDEIFIRISRSF